MLSHISFVGRLRILPDKTGPIILLGSSGTVPFWRNTDTFPLAHAWLIYSELMISAEEEDHRCIAESIQRAATSLTG